MKTRIIKGILVDVQANRIKKIDLNYRGIDDLCKILNCEFVEVITRRIGSKTFSIYLDDVGALKGNIPAAISSDYLEVLYGNLFICRHDHNGEIQSLSELERDYILEFEKTVWYPKGTNQVLTHGLVRCGR